MLNEASGGLRDVAMFFHGSLILYAKRRPVNPVDLTSHEPRGCCNTSQRPRLHQLPINKEQGPT